MESHPVAFLDNDSLRAAHAALCAQEQHKYWEVRDLLFKVNISTKAASASGTAFSGMVLKQISAKAKLDHLSFVECFQSGRHTVRFERTFCCRRFLFVHVDEGRD